MRHSKVQSFMMTAASMILLIVSAMSAASQTFPIATAANEVQFSGGLAFDGSNYMVAFQAGTTISAQLLSPTGALIGKAIAVGSSAKFPSGQLTRSLPPATIAYGGGAYLEVWSDTAISSGMDIFGRRIAPSGTILGSAFPLLESIGGHASQAIRGFECGGTNFLVVWQDAADQTLYGQLVTLSGALSGTEFVISDQQTNAQVGAVAFDGTNYLVVWESGNGSWSTFGAFVSTGGSAGSPFQISQSEPGTQNPLAVAFDGTNYLVVWAKGTPTANGYGKPRTLYGRLVAPDGSFPGNELALAASADDQTFPALQFGGTNYLLVWSDQAGTATSMGLLGQFFDRSVNPARGQFAPLSAPGANKGIIGWGGLIYDGSRFVLAATSAALKIANGSVSGLTSSEVFGEFIPSAFSAPIINTEPLSATNLTGTTAMFTVSVEGSALDYQWYKNKAKLAASSRISGVNSATLTLSNLALGDAGTYFVLASNLFGAATSSNAVLTVKSAVVITVKASPSNVGTVTGGGSYFPGTSVTVTAMATNDCYYFTKWTGGATPSTNFTYTFAATKSETVTANFSPYLYEIQTASAPANGGTTSGGGSKECGASAKVTAKANTGFRFANWRQGTTILTTNSTYPFTATGDVELTAAFTNYALPILTLISPASSVTTTTNSTEGLRGKASDNIAVTGVYYGVSGGEWTPAQGTTNWTATVPLAVGTNVISIYAVDSSGLDSATKRVTIVREFEPNTTLLPIITGQNIKSLQEHIAFDGTNYLMFFQRRRSSPNNNSDGCETKFLC